MKKILVIFAIVAAITLGTMPFAVYAATDDATEATSEKPQDQAVQSTDGTSAPAGETSAPAGEASVTEETSTPAEEEVVVEDAKAGDEKPAEQGDAESKPAE